MFKDHEHECYGTGTVGEKGQIVIPSKAREAMKINSGDEIIFFGHKQMIHMIKAKELNKFLDKMTESITKHVKNIKSKIKDNRMKGK